jgi:hypothetical protein
MDQAYNALKQALANRRDEILTGREEINDNRMRQFAAQTSEWLAGHAEDEPRPRKPKMESGSVSNRRDLPSVLVPAAKVAFTADKLAAAALRVGAYPATRAVMFDNLKVQLSVTNSKFRDTARKNQELAEQGEAMGLSAGIFALPLKWNSEYLPPRKGDVMANPTVFEFSSTGTYPLCAARIAPIMALCGACALVLFAARWTHTALVHDVHCHAMPRHATPRHATPRHATPHHATPCPRRPAAPRALPSLPFYICIYIYVYIYIYSPLTSVRRVLVGRWTERLLSTYARCC